MIMSNICVQTVNSLKPSGIINLELYIRNDCAFKSLSTLSTHILLSPSFNSLKLCQLSGLKVINKLKLNFFPDTPFTC